MVGVSCNYTSGAENAQRVCEIVKRHFDVPVIVGGAHATIAHQEIIREWPVDCVVRGEGERTLIDILSTGCLSVRGTTTKAKTALNREPIEDLDWLPIPDRMFAQPYTDYLRVDAYFNPMQKPVATMSTSRGCPFRCVFCSTQAVWGNRWRGRSAVVMWREVDYLHRTYGVREFAFQDDQFLGSPERIEQFCSLVKRSGFTFIVPPGNSPSKMTPGLLRAMRDAGFYRLCFSVDVGNERQAKAIKKPVMLSKIRPLVRTANRLGIWTYGTFVIGFPDETKAEIKETIRYAYGLGLDFLRFYIAQPHRGSALYDQLKAAGKLPDDVERDRSILDAPADTQHVTADELVRLRNDAECGYLRRYLLRLLNPWVLLTEFTPKLRSPRRLLYFARLAMSAFKVRIRFTRS